VYNKKNLSLSLGVATFILSACTSSTLKSHHDADNSWGSGGLSYYLPKQLHQVEITQAMNEGSCERTLSVTEAALVGDPHYKFSLIPVHSKFRNETLQLTSTTSGLLSSTMSTTEGVADEVIINAVQSAVAVFGIAGENDGGSTGNEPRCDDANIKSIFDFGHKADRQKVRTLLGRYDYEIKYGKALDGLNTSVKLKLDDKQQDKINTTNAVFYRRPVTYLPSISCKNPAASCSINTLLLNLPQGAPIDYLVTAGDSFTMESDGATFTNGMLTNLSVERKSEAVEIAKIPLNIVTAILETPTDLLTLRTMREEGENSLSEQERTMIANEQMRLESERTLLLNQVKLELLQACLLNAEGDVGRTLICTQTNGS